MTLRLKNDSLNRDKTTENIVSLQEDTLLKIFMEQISLAFYYLVISLQVMLTLLFFFTIFLLCIQKIFRFPF